MRFEDLDFVAAIEPAELDRSHGIGLGADPHAAIADLRALDALGGGLANVRTEVATAAAVAAAVARLDALRTSLSGASSSTGVRSSSTIAVIGSTATGAGSG